MPLIFAFKPSPSALLGKPLAERFFVFALSACLTAASFPKGRAKFYTILIVIQAIKTGGRVPRFLYFEREKVSDWELLDVLCSAAPEHFAEKPAFQQFSSPKGQAKRSAVQKIYTALASPAGRGGLA